MPSVWSSVLSHYVDTLIFNRISRLNTWPARTPVNASAAALLLPPHDSGPVWLATPSPYGSFIHYTLPVFPALSGRSSVYKFKISYFFWFAIWRPRATDRLIAACESPSFLLSQKFIGPLP